ncbi:TonB-dependent receptor [Leptospira yasudae]|uniref:TonB-dependent receptor n=1 Tax=Leptospira yasudae TaxID=2202201 RepID=A0A6N4QKK5_9LEPT|nr:TonB-dependent receptor [Leptospira yasudae]TGL82100.1 TonB-dependent receptor [Leptospira yasudae]TGL83197.1 TonB-dependent receptor [Leptospira yasudae]TGL87457.1 TonB-dependent receptor [Leptospira yasudae]
MKKQLQYYFRIFLFSIFLSPFSVFALDVALTGSVKDKEGNPIPNARVLIQESRKSAVSDDKGEFVLDHVPPGKYTLIAIARGYHSESLSVTIGEKDQKIQFALAKSALDESAINVTAKSTISDFLTSPQPITVLSGRQLDRQRGETAMSAINNTPGVSNLTTGAGTSKPIIRGLTGQRVLVMTDGIRQEEQQFGDDHTVELDAFNIQKIEIIRGPGSLLYGSDALGGVVNVIRDKAPLSGEGVPRMAGIFNSNSYSNNKQDAGNFAVFGNIDGFGYRASSNTRKAGRITTPNGTIPNTGMIEKNQSASIGLDGKWGNFYVDSFRREQTQDLFDNPNENPGSTVHQKLLHEKSHFHSFLIFSAGNLELDFSYQRNNRREIESKNKLLPIKDVLLDQSVDVFDKSFQYYQVTSRAKYQGLNLFLDTATADAKFHHKPIFNLLKGTFGVSGLEQKNRTIGTEPLIPSYGIVNVAGYFLEELKLGAVTLSAGVRGDKRSADIRNNAALGITEQTKNYYATTGSTGLVWRINKSFSTALNYGRGFRAPTPFELFSNGVHEGTGKFEIGKNTLKPEYSNNVDLSFRYGSSRIQTEISVFQNHIQNFIYAASIAEIDPESGLPKYKYKQGDAMLRGGEFSIQAEVTRKLVLSGGIDIVHARNQNDTNPLPRTTPNRARAGLRWTEESLWGVQNFYVSINGRFYDSQYRVDPKETPSKGYNLTDIGLGFELPYFGDGTSKPTVDLSVQNVFNVAYVDHLSRYKDYALNPGINAILKVSFPFTVIQ